MLVIKRRRGQTVQIGTSLVRVLAIEKGQVKLGLEAADEVTILRGEVLEIIDENSAKIRWKCMVWMNKQELQEHHASAGTMELEWTFLLISQKYVANLHERQHLVKIPGVFVHQGRNFEHGHSIDLVAEKPTEENPAKKAEGSDAFRTWTDVKGHKIEAIFSCQTVTLKKRDGSEVTVSLERLSEEDRQWIRQQSK